MACIAPLALISEFVSMWLWIAVGAMAIIALIQAIQAQKGRAEQQREIDALNLRLRELERHERPSPIPPVQAAPTAEPPAQQPSSPPSASPRPPAQPVPSTPKSTLDALRAARQQAAQPTTPVTPLHAAPAPTAPAGAQAPQRLTFEERLGARWFVWLGGVALLLAGAFLVKYSYDHVTLSAQVRVSLAAIFGVTLLVLSEVMRQRSARIAEALCGAGVADLFACLLAVVSVYHWLGPAIGLVLLAILTALAVVLSLRHGPFVALLGLVGGFAMPALIGAHEVPTPALLAYLLLLEIALVAVTRRRGWLKLASLTLFASFVWAILYSLTGYDGVTRLWIDGYILASAAVFMLSTVRLSGEQPDQASPWRLAFSATISAAALLGFLTIYGGFSLFEFSALAVLGAGCLVLARLNVRYLALPWIASAVTAVTLLAWWLNSEAFDRPLDPQVFAWLSILFALLYGAGSYACLWRSARAHIWMTHSVLSAVAFTLIARLAIGETIPSPLHWWMIAAAAAAIYALASWPLHRARSSMPHGESALTAATFGAVVFAAMACSMGFSHPWVAVSFAVLSAIVASLRAPLRLPALCLAVGSLTALSVGLLLSLGPADAPGAHVLFNQLLPQYSLPTVAFALAAWRLHRSGDLQLAAVHQVLAVLGLWSTTIVLIRHGFHPAMSGRIHLLEWGSYAAASFAVAFAVLIANQWLAQFTLRNTALTLGALGVAVAAVGCGLLANPLWQTEAVGRLPLLNWLLFLYALPALGAAILARVSKRSDQSAAATVFGVAALALLFAWVSLQVRQGFVGATLVLTQSPVTPAEWYSYSLAWVLLGAALLAGGIMIVSPALRYGSAAVILLAVGKVFLLDTAHLDDLWRVLSLLGLGVSLLGLGFVYQRFVFNQRPNSP
jgi:uncharacterized membrane protein